VENAFKKAMAPRLLEEFNKKLSKGVNLPIGTGKEMVHPGKKMIHMHKDMIVIELGQLQVAPILKSSKFDPTV